MNRRDFLGLAAALPVSGQILGPIIGGAPDLFANMSGYWRSYTGLLQTSGGSVATANNDPVGYWPDLSGNARHMVQSTAGLRPTLQTALPSVAFLGTRYMSVAASVADSIGSVMLVFRTPAASSNQVLLSQSNSAVANEWLEIGITANDQIYIEENSAGTRETIIGSSFLAPSTNYFLLVAYDAFDNYVQLNTVEQTLRVSSVGPFAWFGGVASANNITLGATITSGGAQRIFAGEILEAGIFRSDMSE
jgi:hypothetical protein